MKTKIFWVSGQLPFPLDMLRYDACWPSRGEDVAQIDASLRREEPYKRRRIQLTTPNVPGHRLETERWASFGWVLSMTEPTPELGEVIRTEDRTYQVRWKNRTCAPEFDNRGLAAAYLVQLTTGKAQPQYPEDAAQDALDQQQAQSERQTHN